MYSDKNKFNFMMDERNLLIPRTCDNDLLQPENPFSSIYSQSPIYSSLANQSSSSADSTSPESHLDIFTLFPKLHSEQSNQPAESPLQSYNTFITRKRAIVGRKILYVADQSNSLQENEDECDLSQSNKWVDELLCSSPNRLDENNVTRTYELFPSEKSYSLQIPIQPMSTSTSSIISNMSPTFSTSSGFSNLSHPTVPTFMERCTTPFQLASLSPRTTSPKFSSPNLPRARSSKDGVIASPNMCSFCRKNGETSMVYMAHSLKQKVGSRNIVSCPILRSHVCPSCGVSGDNAHTITYCPVLRNNNNGKRPESTTISLKNTRIKSNGKRRY